MSTHENEKKTAGQAWDSSSGVGEIESAHNAADSEVLDPVAVRRVTRKLDIRIVPMIMWVYLNNMMDRVNIGNARLFGLETDLKLKGNEFQLAVSLLFVTYCLFEAPSNMIIKRLHPARYLAGLTIAWGLVSTFSAFVQNLGGLVACRLILGLSEAGFFPGVVLYLSMFYGRKTLALRISFFYATAAAAGFIGGLLAYGISFMDHAGGWRAWRWIIVIEGVPTVLTGLVIPFVLPNSPDTAKCLSEEDRQILKKIHHQQIGKAHNLHNMVKQDVIDGIKDWKTWANCIALFPMLTMLYSFVVFLPTIIKGIGHWSAAEVQALTVPVYFVGAVVYVLCAWYSDKTQQRGPFIMGGIVVSMVGYAMLIANKGSAVSYAGTFFVAIGIFVSPGIAFAWVPTNNPRYGKRAFATGMHLTFGNSSGIASPFLFANKWAPEFTVGYAVCIGMLAVSFAINLVLHLHFKRVNKLRDEGKFDHLMEGKTEEEIEAMGEESPRFRFSV